MTIITIEDLPNLCSKTKKLVGIDWGEVRIGVAVSDSAGIVASPLCTILCKKKVVYNKNKHKTNKKQLDIKEVRKSISKIVFQESPVAVVVGLPVNMNGSEGTQASIVREFAEKLGEEIGVPILLRDERWSSKAVERPLVDAGLTSEKKQKYIDKMAAAFVLQGVLDYLKNFSQSFVDYV